jgi:hypothetical protein
MVDRRTARLILRSHELLAQLTRIRQEAKEQGRDGWLERAKSQAERVANRTPAATSSDSRKLTR